MESFLIKGGVPLHGTVEISGSKNAALPIMAATLLTDEPCVIRRVPDLSDTRYMVKILESLGASASLENGTLKVDTVTGIAMEAQSKPSDLEQNMHGSH